MLFRSVVETETDFWIVARAVFQNRPNGRAHLLALNVGGVTGNEERGNADERHDNSFVSADAGSFFCRHLRDAISGSVNGKPFVAAPPHRSRAEKLFQDKALTPQLMVCYLLRRHYALSQVRVS